MISPHQKKIKESINFTFSYYFSPLENLVNKNTDLKTDTKLVINTESPKPPKPPKPPPPPSPICIRTPLNYFILLKNSERITKTEGFLCKSSTSNK